MASISPIRVLIVDDEPGARRRLERLLKKEKDIEIIGEANTGKKALTLIQEVRPDLVFLDIQMPVMSGIDVIRSIGAAHMPVVIFVTAYDQYAVKAFELAALDYLMKPFDDERFEQALDRARTMLTNEKSESDNALAQQLETLLRSMGPSEEPTPKYIERIAVDIQGQLRIVPINKIDYITASGNYVYLHTGDEKLLVREQMQNLEEKLPPDQFYRIHRSSIVRLEEIERMIVNPGGDYSIRLRNKMLLKVSRNRWNELSLRLGIQTPNIQSEKA